MGPSATDLGSPGTHRPHRGHKGGHTQRMDGGLALSSMGRTGAPHSLMQSLEHVHLDSAAQHFRLPLPSTFQKYQSHTTHARAAEKTWAQLPGSQHRLHLLGQKYLPPQGLQLLTPFLRGAWGHCTASLGCCSGEAGNVTQGRKGRERPTTHSQVLKRPAPASHPCWQDDKQQDLNANVPGLCDPRPGEAGGAPHSPVLASLAGHSLGAQVPQLVAMTTEGPR